MLFILLFVFTFLVLCVIVNEKVDINYKSNKLEDFKTRSKNLEKITKTPARLDLDFETLLTPDVLNVVIPRLYKNK